MVRLLPALLLVLAAVPASAQDSPVDELKKQLEALKRRVEELETERARSSEENGKLKREIEQLQRFSMDAAEKIARLRQQLAEGGRTEDKPSPGPGPDSPAKPDPAVGPKEPVKGKLVVKVPEHGYIIIDKGEPDGVKEGWVFEIFKRLPGDKYESLGTAVFEKYVSSTRNTQSKLTVTKGSVEKMSYGDLVVAQRALEPRGDAPVDPAVPPTPSGDKTFKITGIAKDSYFLDYGTRDGAKLGDKVYVVRDRRAIVHLRLDSVDKDWSVGRVVDNTKIGEPAMNDPISLKEVRNAVIAKVRRVDKGIYIDAGTMQGARVGMQLDVRRQGRPVGRIVLKQVDKFHSIAEPVGETKLDDVLVDDFVESVD